MVRGGASASADGESAAGGRGEGREIPSDTRNALVEATVERDDRLKPDDDDSSMQGDDVGMGRNGFDLRQRAASATGSGYTAPASAYARPLSGGDAAAAAAAAAGPAAIEGETLPEGGEHGILRSSSGLTVKEREGPCLGRPAAAYTSPGGRGGGPREGGDSGSRGNGRGGGDAGSGGGGGVEGAPIDCYYDSVEEAGESSDELSSDTIVWPGGVTDSGSVALSSEPGNMGSEEGVGVGGRGAGAEVVGAKPSAVYMEEAKEGEGGREVDGALSVASEVGSDVVGADWLASGSESSDAWVPVVVAEGEGEGLSVLSERSEESTDGLAWPGELSSSLDVLEGNTNLGPDAAAEREGADVEGAGAAAVTVGETWSRGGVSSVSPVKRGRSENRAPSSGELLPPVENLFETAAGAFGRGDSREDSVLAEREGPWTEEDECGGGGGAGEKESLVEGDGDDLLSVSCERRGRLADGAPSPGELSSCNGDGVGSERDRGERDGLDFALGLESSADGSSDYCAWQPDFIRVESAASSPFDLSGESLGADATTVDATVPEDTPPNANAADAAAVLDADGSVAGERGPGTGVSDSLEYSFSHESVESTGSVACGRASAESSSGEGADAQDDLAASLDDLCQALGQGPIDAEGGRLEDQSRVDSEALQRRDVSWPFLASFGESGDPLWSDDELSDDLNLAAGLESPADGSSDYCAWQPDFIRIEPLSSLPFDLSAESPGTDATATDATLREDTAPNANAADAAAVPDADGNIAGEGGPETGVSDSLEYSFSHESVQSTPSHLQQQRPHRRSFRAKGLEARSQI